MKRRICIENPGRVLNYEVGKSVKLLGLQFANPDTYEVTCPDKTKGGGRSKWELTGRTGKMKDGLVRSIFENLSKPGDLRIRKMTKDSGGKIRATYVKPPKGFRFRI